MNGKGLETASRIQPEFSSSGHEKSEPASKHGFFLTRGASQREFQGFHEKLKTGFEVFTKHESRITRHGFKCYP